MCQVLTPKLNATVAERVHSLSLEMRHQILESRVAEKGQQLNCLFLSREVLCEGAGAKLGGRCASLPVTALPYGRQQLQAEKKKKKNQPY